MQSPLEHNPELVSLLGLITVRWAALEDALAEVLGAFMTVDDTGHIVLYSMSAFSQRLELVRSTVKSGLKNDRHVAIAERLFNRINKLWATRNQFAHAHYVHRAEYPDGVIVTLIREDGFGINPMAISSGNQRVKSRTFGYIKYGKGGDPEFVPVNKGAMMNHAATVLKRGRQLLALAKAITTGVAPLRAPGELSYQRLSPRSPLFEGLKPREAHILRRPAPEDD